MASNPITTARRKKADWAFKNEHDKWDKFLMCWCDECEEKERKRLIKPSI